MRYDYQINETVRNSGGRAPCYNEVSSQKISTFPFTKFAITDEKSVCNCISRYNLQELNFLPSYSTYVNQKKLRYYNISQ